MRTRGEIANGNVRVHVKAGRSAGAVHLGWRAVIYWLNEPLPVILVPYDARADRAWRLDLQDAARAAGRQSRGGARLTLRIPRANVLNREAIRRFRILRDGALGSLLGLVS